MSHIFVVQYCYMLSTLSIQKSLILTTLEISLIFIRIILILYFISSQLKITRILLILLRKLVHVTRISWDLIISLTMGPLSKKICMNTTSFSNQSVGNPLISKKSLNMSLFLWRLPLVQLNIQLTRLKIKFLKEYNTVGKTINLA